VIVPPNTSQNGHSRRK